MVTSTPTSQPSNASPTQPNGRPMQRAPLPASKSDCKITFIDVFYSAKPGLPIWMAGRKQHGRKQSASEKFKTRASPRAIETTRRDLTTIISSTKAPMPRVTHLAMTASYQWTLTLHPHHAPQHHH